MKEISVTGWYQRDSRRQISAEMRKSEKAGAPEPVRMKTTSTTSIRRSLLELARERGTGKTFCPSEVARALDGKAWRDLMSAVRAEAGYLVAKGQLTCFQKGRKADPVKAKGPIRLGLPE